MSRPTTLPDFATSGTNVIEPSSGLKTSGWFPGTSPPAQLMNWCHHTVALWITYFASIIPDGPVALAADVTAAAAARLRSKLLTALTNYVEMQLNPAVVPSTLSINSVGYWSDGAKYRLLAVGVTGRIFSSEDFGRTWTQQTQAGSYTGQFFRCVPKASGWIAVGSAAGIQTAGATAVTWTARTAAGAYGGDFKDVAAGNGVCVAVGSGALQVQASVNDGATWAVETPVAGCTAIAAITCNDTGTFVYVDSAAKVIGRSANGTTWTAPTPASDLSDRFVDVKWCRTLGLFLALAKNNASGLAYLHSSPDGITWTARANAWATAPRTIVPTRYGVLLLSDSDVHITLDGITIALNAAGGNTAFGTAGLPSFTIIPQNVSAAEMFGADQYTAVLIAEPSTNQIWRSGVIVTD